MSRRTGALRVLGSFDLASGAFALADASWLSKQLDLGATPIRVIGAFLLVLGVETLLLREKPVMGRVAMVVEAVFGLAAVDVALMADPTAIGTALLIGTALYCATAALWLFALQRTPRLVTA